VRAKRNKPKGLLRIATCQFAVSGSIRRNAGTICEMLRKAARARADIAHFPECALSGYAGVDFESFDSFDWSLLKERTERVMALAGKLGVWVVLGSTHRLSGSNKPHNCLYLISPQGKLADRYDKRFCLAKELAYYTPGNRFVTFDVNGVRCALLICFDARFPELYRRLYKRKVNCILQSFYNARQKGPSVHTHIIRQTMQTRAATNYFWVSMANASGYYSPYPSCFIQPDGRIVRQLKTNRAGLMVNIIDLGRDFYDPMAGLRELAIAGRLSNAPQRKRR